MSAIEVVDQTFRDGQQSLWGMRLRTGMVRAVASELDSADYRAIDITGSSMFECVIRYSRRENPCDGLDLWRRWMARSNFRCGVGSNRIVKFGMTPDSILDLRVQTLAKHGLNSFWVYDCLDNSDQMQRLCDTIHKAGAQAYGAIFYGISPVHTDEWFADRVAEMVSWHSTSGIYVEDAPGILAADRARTLIPALLAAAGDKPVEWHFHNLTGVGALNYVTAMEFGGSILHSCSRPLLNGPSLLWPAPIDENVPERVLSSPHGREYATWERPQPSLKEVRAQYGETLSDEDLLLRYMVPAEDIDAMKAAGPLKPDYDFTDPVTLAKLVEHFQTLNRPKSLRVRGPFGSVDLRASR